VSVVKGGIYNFGLHVFWSNEGLAVSWDDWGGVRWLFEDWKCVLKSIQNSIDINNIDVKHVEICWSDGIVIALKNEIVVLKVVRQNQGTYRNVVVS